MDKKDYYYNPKEFRGRNKGELPRESDVMPFWIGALVGFVIGCGLSIYVALDKELSIKIMDILMLVRQWFA